MSGKDNYEKDKSNGDLLWHLCPEKFRIFRTVLFGEIRYIIAAHCICYGSGSGSDFWKVMVPVPVPVPTFEKVTVPVPVPAPYLDHKKQIFPKKFWKFFWLFT